jgi:ATP-dependent DNA helicase PIF1
MLNEMRLGKISPETERAFQALARPLTFDDGVDLAELFPTRHQVEESNNKRLRELKGKVYKYEASDMGHPEQKERLLANMMAPKSLDLKMNAQVMLIKNLDDTLVNGSLGKVIGFSDEKLFDLTNPDEYDDQLEKDMAKAKRKLSSFSRDAEEKSDGQQYPVVQFRATDGAARVVLCQPMEWKVELPNGDVQAKRTQVPLILAWALSIHKAQGQTLERVTVDLRKVFEKGQAYVALSRATSQQGLRVIGFNKSKVMAHPRVVAFYNKLYSVEEAMGRKPKTMADFVNSDSKSTAPAPVPAQPKAAVIQIDDDEEEAYLAAYGH